MGIAIFDFALAERCCLRFCIKFVTAEPVLIAVVLAVVISAMATGFVMTVSAGVSGAPIPSSKLRRLPRDMSAMR